MNYYFLLKPCVGYSAGRDKLVKNMSTALENFISYENLERWFDIPADSFTKLSEYDSILDLRNSPNINTIALYISPYKRVFYYFLTAMNVRDVTDLENLSHKISPENFTLFCQQSKDRLDSYLTNLTDAYQTDGDLKIHYELEYDTLVDDMRKIPGLENTPTDFVTENQRLLNRYKEFYTPETKELIASYFSKDIEQRGYTF